MLAGRSCPNSSRNVSMAFAILAQSYFSPNSLAQSFACSYRLMQVFNTEAFTAYLCASSAVAWSLLWPAAQSMKKASAAWSSS